MMDHDTPSLDEDRVDRHMYVAPGDLEPVTAAAIRAEAKRLLEFLKSMRVDRPTPELSRLKDLLVRGKSIDSTPLGQQARVSLRCDDKSLAELTERVQQLLTKVWQLTLYRDLPSSRVNPSRIVLTRSRFASGSRRADWSLKADGHVYDEAGNLVFDTRLHTAGGPLEERQLLHELLMRLGRVRTEVLGVKFAQDTKELKLAARAFVDVLRERLTRRS